MPKIVNPLTDARIRNAKPQEKEYNLSAGYGLQLRVKPIGTKLWLFNYTNQISGKRTNISIGRYPAVTLKMALSEREKCHSYLATGQDPKIMRKRSEAATKEAMETTFSVIYDRWLDVKRPVVSPLYLKRLVNAIDLHLLPKLGGVPIGEISAPLTIDVLRPIGNKGKLETVRKLCRWLNEIMDFAVNTGVVGSNPLSGIRKAFQPPTTINHPTLKPYEIPEFMRALEAAQLNIVTKNLILWMFYTLARPGEAASAEWSEIDFENEIWVIPQEKMKQKREHKIPLSTDAMKLLHTMWPLSGHKKYVFPARNHVGGHVNSETANTALKRMGYKSKFVSHGIRALGSTVLHEEGYDSAIIELSLAHVDKNHVRAAYNRAEYLDRRREMMEWWSRYINK